VAQRGIFFAARTRRILSGFQEGSATVESKPGSGKIPLGQEQGSL